jgi:hypothetical protein
VSAFGIDIGRDVHTDLASVVVLLILVIIGVVRFVTRTPGPRRLPWHGVFHPFGLAVALCSALLAWSMSSVHNLAAWSDRALWVLVAGMVAYVASAVVVSLWPPGLAGARRLQRARDRVSKELDARVRLSSPTCRHQLEALRVAALTRIDDEILPPFAQLVQRDTGVNSEILAYRRSSAEPNEEVIGRLQVIHEQYQIGTRACVQRIVDAEARLFAVLQERDDVVLGGALLAWIDNDLGQLAKAVDESLTLPLGPVSAAPAPAPEPEPLAADVPELAMQPQPPKLADLTRRTLRSLNKPATLAKSELIPLFAESLNELWHQSEVARSSDPSPLEQSQLLRTLLVRAIEQLRVSDAGSTRDHQYQVLRMQYVMGLNVIQVSTRLGIAEQGVYRRSAEGVEALANDLWRRERLLVARGRDDHSAAFGRDVPP